MSVRQAIASFVHERRLAKGDADAVYAGQYLGELFVQDLVHWIGDTDRKIVLASSYPRDAKTHARLARTWRVAREMAKQAFDPLIDRMGQSGVGAVLDQKRPYLTRLVEMLTWLDLTDPYIDDSCTPLSKQAWRALVGLAVFDQLTTQTERQAQAGCGSGG